MDGGTTFSLLTREGRRDVRVATAGTVADLLSAVDLPPRTRLVTSGGTLLEPDADVAGLSGEVLTVVGARAEDRSRGSAGQDAHSSVAAALWVAAGAAGALALVRAAALLGGDDAVPVAPVLAAGVLALLLALLPDRFTRGAGTARTVGAWTAAVAAGLTATPSLLDPGTASPLLVPGTVALLAAAAVTALRYVRTHGTPDAPTAGAVLVVTAALAAAGAGAVVLGTGAHAVAAALLGVVPLVVRALPAGSLDVPDHVVVDLETAQHTATTVRARPVTSPPFVRGAVVERAVVTGRSRRRSATVVVALAALLVAPLALLAPRPELLGWADHAQLWATGALGVLVATALALGARGERSSVERLAPRVVAGVVAVLTLLWFLREVDLAVVLVASGVALALVALATARALGRGWRSVRWSRTADAVESCAVALAPAVGLVAAGLLAWARLLASG